MIRGVVLLFCVSALMGQQHYDLGGPCAATIGVMPLRLIRAARKAGDWDRLIELEKQSVRNGCEVAPRWLGLANALVEASRRQEAVAVLTEMDARGFDLGPSALGQGTEALRKFMTTPEFLSSAVGKKVAQLRKISDDRRLRYRATLAKLPADQKPPVDYVAKGACPFECCTYREWSVEQDTDLVAAPGSRRIVGRAKKGTRVRGMTGEVHLQPEPVVMLRDSELPKDSLAFVLDYEGEGFWHVWSQGRTVSMFLVYAEYCLRVSEACAAETLFPATPRKPPVWWVKIRLPNGAIGWSDKADHFGNKDLCG